jgi:hypothetical protein
VTSENGTAAIHGLSQTVSTYDATGTPSAFRASHGQNSRLDTIDGIVVPRAMSPAVEEQRQCQYGQHLANSTVVRRSRE